MVLAAEFTTTTLVAWIIAALVLGMIIGTLLRPWLVRDRLESEYDEKLAAERGSRETAESSATAASQGLAATKRALDGARADAIRASADLATATRRVTELEASLEALGLEKAAESEKLAAAVARAGELEAAVAERDARIAEVAEGSPAVAAAPPAE